MKLNKNQRKFFHVAVNHFGEKATDVRFKDLKSFAEEMDLIIPISALKKYCQDDGQVRGHYNLTLTGFKPEKVEVPEPEFEIEDTPVITEVSSFVPEVVKKKKSQKFDKEGKKPIDTQEPVFIVINPDFHIVSVHETPQGAFDSGVRSVLHDEGDRNADNVTLELLYTGISCINSTNSGMYFIIHMYEMRR